LAVIKFYSIFETTL